MGLFSFFKKKKKDIKNLNFESKWFVEINGDEIRTLNSEGIESTIKTSDIRQILIETNDSGPWRTDIWWRIIGKEELLSIPSGARGESELLEHFQKLPKFNNEEFVKAMCSTDNALFICWEHE